MKRTEGRKRFVEHERGKYGYLFRTVPIKYVAYIHLKIRKRQKCSA